MIGKRRHRRTKERVETAQKNEGEGRDRLRSRRHESKLRIDIK